MQKFIEELPTLIITLALLGLAGAFVLIGHSPLAEIAGFILAPLIAFWFLGKAYAWSPPQPEAPPTTKKEAEPGSPASLN